jgi:hypothetical protein
MIFLFLILLLFPALAQATPITFGIRDTNDQLTIESMSPPAPSDLYLFGALGGGPIRSVNLLGYDGQPLNSKDLSHYSLEPPVWLTLGAGFIGLAIATHHRRK